jgi:hypothetical protein
LLAVAVVHPHMAVAVVQVAYLLGFLVFLLALLLQSQ